MRQPTVNYLYASEGVRKGQAGMIVAAVIKWVQGEKGRGGKGGAGRSGGRFMRFEKHSESDYN